MKHSGFAFYQAFLLVLVANKSKIGRINAAPLQDEQ
jgi:hypothetical protein